MSEPVVFVNGTKVGAWKNGYNAFRVDISSAVKRGQQNKLLVRLNNEAESSRWYPGAGLYRPVHLRLTSSTYLDDWDSFVYTSQLDGNEATIEGSIGIKGKPGKNMKVGLDLLDAQGKRVAGNLLYARKASVPVRLKVNKPNTWSPESPYLYTLHVTLRDNNRIVDDLFIKTGIRKIEVSKDKGFALNGISRKLQGVCLHHDLGPLGAAVNKAALIRQIRLLKDMGCDAIRTSHNMPSQMQMEVCDSMGMMVMTESFDEWAQAKMKNGYNRFWNEWWRKDVTHLVKGHRNHPCIVMWSAGNEIPEQSNGKGAFRADSLVQLFHELDPTRPVTCGMNQPDEAIKVGFAQKFDVPGFNYRIRLYKELLPQLPQGFILGSETTSSLSTRGEYFFPVDIGANRKHSNGQSSSYDTEHCFWSNLPDDDWKHQDEDSFLIGEFVWSGFDYLGEPTPYDNYWPSRSSYFGILDLAGLPKDRYFLYRSKWNNREHTIHLLPHWSWPGREGETTPVYCYTDYPEAELFVNGKSQGRIKKQKDSRLDRYRLRWNDVRYEPGELKVVVFDAKGDSVGQQVVRTAGEVATYRLTADRKNIKADGNDLAFVTVEAVDKDGNLCPDADLPLHFAVEGAGSFKAVCNGDPTSLESFAQPTMKLFHGKLVVVLQAGRTKGKMTLTVNASTQGTKPAQISIPVSNK